MSNLKLFFAGDTVIDPGTTTIAVGEKLKKVISGCDLVSCNFEAPIKTEKSTAMQKVGPSLFQGKNAVVALRNAGFNFFNLANNHILDYGYDACANTIKEVKDCAGAGSFEQCYSHKLIEIKGTRIALISLAEWGFGIFDESGRDKGQVGYAWIHHPAVEDLVRRAKKDADIVIAQLHAGVEDIWVPWPEWRATYRKIVDWGCDLVIGHHPHVPHGYESYNGKKIFYSLGNFYFDMESNHPYWDKGYCVEVDITGKVITGTTVHWTEKKGPAIEIVNDQEYVNFEAELCGNLQEPKYSSLVSKYADELWKDRYSIYYTTSFNTLSQKLGIGYNLKSVAKYVLGRDQMKNNMLLHNLSIESHRFVVERYLKNTWRKSANLAQ